jgi:hypothetical protein
MSDIELVELAIMRTRDTYKAKFGTNPDEAFYQLLDRLAVELRQLKRENDPHRGLGRSGL